MSLGPFGEYIPNVVAPESPGPAGGGSGSPEGSVVGTPFQTYYRTDDNTFWVKETGVGTTTGWQSYGGGGGAATAPVTLTPGATVATDASLGSLFRLTPVQNFTLSNPTNPTDGQRIVWEIIQDGTGSRIFTPGSKFAFGSDITAIVLTTTPAKRDYITAIYNSTADKYFVVGFIRGM